MTTQLGLFGDDKDVHNKRPRRQLPEDRGQLKLFRDSEVLQFIVNLTHRVYFQVPFPTQQRAAASPLISGMTAAGHTYLITRDLTGYTPINNHAANDKDQPF